LRAASSVVTLGQGLRFVTLPASARSPLSLSPDELPHPRQLVHVDVASAPLFV